MKFSKTVSSDKQTRIRNIIFITILLTLAITARLVPGARTIDDSFITYRYARNLLSGEGFTYNPGEKILGTTTPFYTLLMVGLATLTGGAQASFPTLSLFINTFADVFTCLILWQIGKELDSEWAGFTTGLIWAVAPFSVTFAIGGLETSVYVLLLSASVYFYLTRHRKTTTLLASFSILTRPDAIILIGPLALDRLVTAIRKNERIQLDEILAFILPGLAWGIFATLYFGTPIPHSVTAKIAVYQLQKWDSFIRLLQHYAVPFMAHHIFGTAAIIVGIFLFPFLYIIGIRHCIQKNSSIIPFALYPLLYLIIFSLPNPLIFRWYLTPPLPAYFLFILIGLHQILIAIFNIKIFKHPLFRSYIPAALLVVFSFSSLLSAWEIHPDHGQDKPAPKMAWIELELLYQQASTILDGKITTDQVLAAGDVGVLGFYTNAHILDTVGLNSAQSLKYYPIDSDLYVINYAIPTQLILEEQPDWIVILEVYGRKTFLVDETFNQTYELYKKIPTEIYGSDGMLIFRRNP